MRKRMIDNMVRWRSSWRTFAARHTSGQVAIYMALLLSSLMGLAGTGVDYGLIVVQSARLQNAIDAAALAGARALVTSTGANQTARNTDGQTAATNFLTLHGYTNGANGVTFTFTPLASDGGTYNDMMRVNATVVLPTRFWRVIGIQTTTLNQAATAAASGSMADVVLALDLTGSMERSGTDDLGQLRDAVVEFIDQMKLDTTDPRGTKVAIARFAGIRCRWDRGYTGAPTTHGDGDLYIDQNRGPNGSEYITPCDDDKTMIAPLTQDRATLVKVARNDGAAACPAAAVGYGCPLVSWKYQKVPVTYGTPTASGTPVSVAGLQTSSSTKLPDATADCNSASEWCMATGTKIANGLTVAKDGGYCAWSTANGGRNDAATTGIAKKVLVIMTDGKNESSQLGIPTNYTPTVGNWDEFAKDVANGGNTAGMGTQTSIKYGCDGVQGTYDDVEIYVVGFFCSPYDSGSSWCLSKTVDAYSGGKHICPGTMPASGNRSSLDDLLISISSSTSGTCDHYFPIKKTEDLPTLFKVISGSIARGKLQ